MFITLLTHSEELKKNTNTGRLVAEYASTFDVDCARVIWQRKVPDPQLLERLRNKTSALLYPAKNAKELNAAFSPEHWVLIDSTWQQARKIYNHSPYLHPLPHINLSSNEGSVFSLRRNQVPGGLCTSESVAAIAATNGMGGFARCLADALEAMQS
ncbi:tRNA-uridine aminocarboxypropyltransferase [Gilvimarinus xylanilyticus]|uniref:tRNA-uridine aminocarboxypropyltransferase n=1 Tax=Gilvimarinus xylanilyticus TaxID=2944139 RepID=A0A9X2KTA0_9GAMM|nr:tRNA-uridine aminocarboxypropyltransferase [Gilvimarinus xylanilyticus]MCP8899696.1 DTW domain-containing protein [Gilvimarinus xylanilyticus]